MRILAPLIGIIFCIAVANPLYGAIWDLGGYFDPSTATAVNGPFDYRKGPQPPGSDPAVSTTRGDLVPHSDIFNTPGDGFASVGGVGGFPTPMIMNNSSAQIAGITESIASHSYITVAWTAPHPTVVNIDGHIRELAGTRGLFWHFDLKGSQLSNGVVMSNQMPHSFLNGSGGVSALRNVSVNAGDVLFLTVQDVVFSQVGVREDLFGLRYTITEVPEPSAAVSALLVAIALLVRSGRSKR